jgi:hypothetical protein
MTLGNMRELGAVTHTVTCELRHHEAVLRREIQGGARPNWREMQISTVPTDPSRACGNGGLYGRRTAVPEGLMRLPFFRSDECAYQFIENLDQALRRLTATAPGREQRHA